MARRKAGKGGGVSPVEELTGASAAVDPLLPLVVSTDHASGALDASSKRIRREQLRLLMRSWTFVIGAALLLLWITCAMFGDALSPANPLAQDLLSINQAPSSGHLFGTDNLGRDVFSRVVTGAREIMIAAPIASFLGTALGTILGLVQGYYRGAVDAIMGRIVDAFMALPYLVVLFLFLVALGPSIASLILVIASFYGIIISRTVRSAVLQESELDYVAAARLRGEGAMHTMFVEILPNVLPLIVVEFTVRLGYAIFALATLGYLGFGIQPPTPDWGADIATNAHYLSAGYWWPTVFPALAIASLITAINLIGDSIESVTSQ